MSRMRRRGVTITELVVVMLIFMLVLGGMVLMATTASSEWSRGSSKMMADNEASLALQRLARDIRDGLSASTDSSRTRLTVVMPAVNAQGDYDRYTSGATRTYYLDGGRLYRRVDAGNPTVMADGLTSVQFTVNGTQIGLQLTARQRTGTRTGVTTYATQVTLRNEPSTS